MDSEMPRASKHSPPDIPAPPPTCPASKWETQLTHPAIHHDIKADPVGFHQRAELHPRFISVIFGKPGETRPEGDLSLAGPSQFDNTDLAAQRFISIPRTLLTTAPEVAADPLADSQLKIHQDL